MIIHYNIMWICICNLYCSEHRCSSDGAQKPPLVIVLKVTGGNKWLRELYVCRFRIGCKRGSAINPWLSINRLLWMRRVTVNTFLDGTPGVP